MIKKIFGSKVEIIIEEIKTFLKMVWIKYRNHSHNHRKKFGAKKSQCSISRLKSIDFFLRNDMMAKDVGIRGHIRSRDRR